MHLTTALRYLEHPLELARAFPDDGHRRAALDEIDQLTSQAEAENSLEWQAYCARSSAAEGLTTVEAARRIVARQQLEP